MDWHKLDIEQVFKETGSSRTGLSAQGVEGAREKHGSNELEEAKKTPPWKQFLEQFKSFMIIVLIAAAVISGIVGDKTDTIIILIIVLLNAVIGFLQEYRAEKAMSALRSIGTPNSRVVREGKERNIKSTDIVPGDVVILEAGVIVPADMRLFELHSLRIEESALTGESVAVDKVIKPLEEEAAQLGDRLNMGYKGTKVTNGRGLGVVTATGMNTEIGKIAQMLQEPKTSTPLQLKMEDFGKKLSYLIIAICAVLFLIGLLRGEEPLNMLLVAISLAVAAIPEALPALITIALAQGAKRLVKKNALIRKLPAVETLGSVSYICTDKTGTLTRNSMTVMETHDGHSPADMPSLQTIMCLNHDVAVAADGALLGDPMETAIVDYVRSTQNVDVVELQQKYPRVAEIPFDADRKCMTTVHGYDDQYLIVSKGAVEAITRTMDGGVGTTDLTNEINEKNRLLASQGMRVIAYGYKFARDISEPLNEQEIESGLTYAGLVALIDPPREEVKPAILECKEAGIQPVMITGDHPETAAAIAQKINLLTADDLKISGYELNELSQEDFEKDVERIKVYARVSPEQKLQIVKALQSRNHFVAMTGDGVNDAPSLKVANIGVAMGITGTDVSKESSDMILLDDNFATIVNAIKEGRRIYDNIRKFVRYIMTCNSAEIWTIFVAPIIGLPIPLLPIHLLWINLVTDGLPGLALSAEKPEADIMRRPPRGRNESLFSHGAGTHIIWVGILMAALTLGIEMWAVKTNNPNWQTMVFTVLSLAQLGHVFAIRSEKEYIFKVGLFSNRPLAFAVLFTFALQLAVIYLPVANDLLKTKPLPLNDLLICMLGPVVIFFGVELEKFVRRRRHLD
jgi:Ca2+-transporting ATPase